MVMDKAERKERTTFWVEFTIGLELIQSFFIIHKFIHNLVILITA